MAKLYLIGSLRNPRIPEVAATLRGIGYDVFDDWYAAGPEADDYWRDYEKNRGHDLVQALDGIAANHVYSHDHHHLDTSDLAVLLLPAGRSGHLELGFMVGRGKPTHIVLDGEPERYDVMYRFATAVHRSVEEMVEWMQQNSKNESVPVLPVPLASWEYAPTLYPVGRDITLT